MKTQQRLWDKITDLKNDAYWVRETICNNDTNRQNIYQNGIYSIRK